MMRVQRRSGLLVRLRTRGLAAPVYQGVLGKLRQAREEFVVREDILFCSTPETFRPVAAPALEGFEVRLARGFEDVAPHVATFEREYHPGYLDRWPSIFARGERLVLAFQEGRLVGFHWYVLGTAAGQRGPYGMLLDGDVRCFRAGVFPSERRHGFITKLSWVVMRDLYAAGLRRIYGDCNRGNVPMARMMSQLGFAPVALVTVLPLGGFLRFRDPAPVYADLKAMGLAVAPPGGQGSA